MPSDLVVNRRGGKGLYRRTGLALPDAGDTSKAPVQRKAKTLPEYLDASEAEALIRFCDNPKGKLTFLIQWRAGLRISEALALSASDVDFEGRQLKVRQGKGKKDRVVALHSDLAGALSNAISFGEKRGPGEPLVGASRQAAHLWFQAALKKAIDNGLIRPGRKLGTHTLRHSACRHWLASGVPINVVQFWMGHTNLQVTAIYLRLIADPGGYMERVP